jgi:hypothetical protein
MIMGASYPRFAAAKTGYENAMSENDFQDRQAEREAEAAAAEAGAIGGRVSPEDGDPADRAVREGGGGEAEGFELAEEALHEHAEHGDSGPDPSHMAGEPEAESDRSTAVYGEADAERSSEAETERSGERE